MNSILICKVLMVSFCLKIDKAIKCSTKVNASKLKRPLKEKYLLEQHLYKYFWNFLVPGRNQGLDITALYNWDKKTFKKNLKMN